MAGINGFEYVAVVAASGPLGPLGYENLLGALMLLPVFAGIILTEATVVGEYRIGIAAWLVSKPVSIGGCVAAKLIGLWIGLPVTAIAIPGLMANWWLPKFKPYRFVIPEAPELGRFLVAFIDMVLWLVLRFAPAQIRPSRHRYLPIGLMKADLDVNSWIPGMEYIHGNPFDPVSAVWATVAASLVFVGAAMLLYRRLEL